MRSADAHVRPAHLAVLAATWVLSAAAAPSNAQQPTAGNAPPTAPAVTTQTPAHADGRTAALAKSLGLSAAQQSEVDRILTAQREQLHRLWKDQQIPPAYRVGETRAINARTEDQIRAILTDEQKKKYISPRPNELPPTVHSDLEHWLNATQPN